MQDELNKRNLYLKWKECEIIQCDDIYLDDKDWHRIAILKYKGKLYYVSIYSGIIQKVESLEYELGSKRVEQGIDFEIDQLQKHFKERYEQLKAEEEAEQNG